MSRGPRTGPVAPLRRLSGVTGVPRPLAALLRRQRLSRTAPPGQQPTRHVLDRERVADVVAPGAVDVELTPAYALLAEAELLHHPSAGVVLRPDVRLDPVEADREEAVIDGHGEGGGDDAPPGERAVDPVAHLTRSGRAPDDG